MQGSELGVLPGVDAGLLSFLQAAAADRRLLGHVSQRIGPNQVPGRQRQGRGQVFLSPLLRSTFLTLTRRR